MTYIPSNRIKTNLYTNGYELKISSTGVNYVGPYWKKYTGEMFTGKTPNDKPSQLLTPFTPAQSNNALTNKTSYSLIEVDDTDTTLVQEYLNVNQLDHSKQVKFLPLPFYPTPTKDDYDLGVFPRYFCVKTNENAYIEISKKTYDAITTQKKDWLWELYTPFQLIWTIKGEEKEVEKTNYNITILQEQRLKRVGLKEFLRNNYLKFFK